MNTRLKHATWQHMAIKVMRNTTQHNQDIKLNTLHLQQLQNEDVKVDFAFKVKQFLSSNEEVGAEQLAEVLNAAVTEVIPEVEKLNKKWISAKTLEF